MKLDVLRLKRVMEDVHKLIYRHRLPIDQFKILDDKRQDGYLLDDVNWKEFVVGENWRGTKVHRWFRTKIEIPANYEGETVVFRLTTGREGQWDACNPQFLFYVNQTLVQGCDVNHREVIITEDARAAEVYEIAFLAYSGSEGSDLLIACELFVLDNETEALYYDLKIPIESIELIYDKDAYHKSEMLRLLNPIVDHLDLRAPYSSTYYENLTQCRRMLKESFYSHERDEQTVYAIGNTHIDIAWLWTVEQTREKVLRSYSTVIELMDRYPDYKFIGSQAILYQFVKEQNPKLYERIKEKISMGQWEVEGGMWLEADCNIPSGESLVRQFLKGELFFEKEFGTRSKILWLPDVFGYSAALPQILKQFDMPYFVTTKLAWNQYNQLPNDTFVWRGLDGSEVFTFMPTTCDYNKNMGNNISFTDTRNTTTYTGILGPNMTLGTYERFQNKDLLDDTLMLYGYGDGGGGPTKEMLENEKRLKYGLPGVPKIKTSFCRDYLDMAYDKIRHQKNRPTWDGELYFEYHRGTLTSNGQVKSWNRKLEILLRKLEILTTSRFVQNNISVPKKVLSKIWDVVLLNQFHDIIPGTSISEVYEVTNKEYAEAYDMAMDLIDQENVNDQVTVFNDLPFLNTDVIKAAVHGHEYGSVKGTDHPVQYISDNEIIFIGDVPAFSSKTYEFEPGSHQEFQAQIIDGFEFDNEFYQIIFNDKGQIESLKEKGSGYEYFDDLGNQLIAYEDRPANWDNWDVDAYYRRKPYGFDTTSEMRLIENGPIRWTIETHHTMGQSHIKQLIHMYKELPRIEFAHEVDWREHHLLLRTEFPTNLYQNKATFDIQYGSVERETTANHSWDTAKFETCGHKWMDMGHRTAGISLMSDSKYGYSARGGTLGLSLIKSGKYPNETADIRKHNYRYAIYPHQHQWFESSTIEQAEMFNGPMLRISQETCVEPIVNVVEGDVFIDAIKMAEKDDRIIIRLHEHKNGYEKVKLVVHDQLFEPNLVNLREEVIDALSMKEQVIELTFKPFEIKTISFHKKSDKDTH